MRRTSITPTRGQGRRAPVAGNQAASQAQPHLQAVAKLLESYFYRVTYSSVSPKNGARRGLRGDEIAIYKSRDAEPILELVDPLYRAGYIYGTTIMLYPDDDRGLEHYPRIKPSDCLVLTTRPPLSDRHHTNHQSCGEGNESPRTPGEPKPHRRLVPPANCEFQDCIFEGIRRFLKSCSRKQIELTDEAMAWLREDVKTLFKNDRIVGPEALRKTDFFEYWAICQRVPNLSDAEFKAFYQKDSQGNERSILVAPDRKQHCSLAYFIRIEKLPVLECPLICCFGLNAMCTLIWTRFIRLHYAHWISTPGDRFAMAVLDLKKSLMAPTTPEKPITPMFNDRGEYAEARLLTRETLA